jgi:hypothetical protein
MAASMEDVEMTAETLIQQYPGAITARELVEGVWERYVEWQQVTVFFLMGSIQRNCQHIIDTSRGNHDEA